MIKYYCEYTDTENVGHRFEIENDDFNGSATEVGGYVEFEYLEVDDVLEAIRGSALKIYLEADINLTFEDLYSDQERTFKVTYYRSGQVKFIGFLNPDGIFQDWVNDKWEISLDVSGGLGYLENLSYPSTGGKEKEIEIIAKCLKRTGLELYINTSLITNYVGQPSVTDVLDNVYQDTGRFIKEDGETTMSCEDVLRGVLEKYCASIFQIDGFWVIRYIPSLTLANNTYYTYDYNGVYKSTNNYSFGTSIGSQINGAYPHHCGANQKIEIQPSIGAYRVNFKYGFVNSLNDNPGLINNGSSVNGWNTPNPSVVNINSDGYVDVINDNSLPDSQLALQSVIGILLNEGDELNIKAELMAINGASSIQVPFLAKIIANGSSNTYNLAGNLTSENGSLTWTTDSVRTVYAQFDDENVYYNINKIAPPIPEPSVVVIEIYELPVFISISTAIRVNYFGIGIQPKNDKAEGEFHTFERISNSSSVIRDSKEVSVADSPVNLYSGALYENDQTTLTTEWNHGSINGVPIIYIMGQLTMQAFQNPAKVFSGDVYGYVKFPGGYYINGVNGKFIITSYRYNTKTNVTEIKAVEVFPNSISEDVRYRKTIDYGNSSTPTID